MSHIAVFGVLRGAAGGITEEATDRGFPSPSFSGFGFIGVANDLSIVAGWQIGGRSPKSALGRKATLGQDQWFSGSNVCLRPKADGLS